jgi:methionyl-tRNA synthetase
MAAGLEPPKRVFAHGWWTNEGQKISKSLGNVIDPHALIERYGRDQVRYFLLREVPFGNDGDFSHRAIVQRMNGDLANGIGNLGQRVLSMINKNCDAKVPTHGVLTEADQGLLGAAHGLLPALRHLMTSQQFHKALETIWQVVSEADRYVDEQAPWALKKTDPARMATVLYVLAETIRHLALLVQPFMPESGAKILDQLAVGERDRSFAALGPEHALTSGTDLPKPEGVFPRFVEETAA